MEYINYVLKIYTVSSRSTKTNSMLRLVQKAIQVISETDGAESRGVALLHCKYAEIW